jgi:hypothetical protein
MPRFRPVIFIASMNLNGEVKNALYPSAGRNALD